VKEAMPQGSPPKTAPLVEAMPVPSGISEEAADAGVCRLEARLFQARQRVQYWSRSEGQWLNARVLQVNEDGSFHLSCKRHAKPELMRSAVRPGFGDGSEPQAAVLLNEATRQGTLPQSGSALLGVAVSIAGRPEASRDAVVDGLEARESISRLLGAASVSDQAVLAEALPRSSSHPKKQRDFLFGDYLSQIVAEARRREEAVKAALVAFDLEQQAGKPHGDTCAQLGQEGAFSPQLARGTVAAAGVAGPLPSNDGTNDSRRAPIAVGRRSLSRPRSTSAMIASSALLSPGSALSAGQQSDSDAIDISNEGSGSSTESTPEFVTPPWSRVATPRRLTASLPKPAQSMARPSYPEMEALACYRKRRKCTLARAYAPCGEAAHVMLSESPPRAAAPSAVPEPARSLSPASQPSQAQAVSEELVSESPEGDRALLQLLLRSGLIARVQRHEEQPKDILQRFVGPSAPGPPEAVRGAAPAVVSAGEILHAAVNRAVEQRQRCPPVLGHGHDEPCQVWRSRNPEYDKNRNRHFLDCARARGEDNWGFVRRCGPRVPGHREFDTDYEID